jgi:hypothetical protein
MGYVRLVNRRAVENAWKAFHALFVNARSCDQPLREPGSGMILMDVRVEMSQAQYSVIARAATTEGDTEAYLSYLGGTEPYAGSDQEMSDDFEIGPHFRIELDENPLQQLNEDDHCPQSEYALYSPSGTWGVLASLEWYAIAVGSESFRRQLGSAPEFSESLQRFLRYWKDSRDRLHGRTGWIPDLVENVYGLTEGRKIMSNFGEPRETWARNG